MTEEVVLIEAPTKLARQDFYEAIRALKPREVEFIVYSYYSVQKDRVRLNNRAKALMKQGEPLRVTQYLLSQAEAFEKEVRKILAQWIKFQGPHADWLLSIRGIGPVLASGLISTFDVEKAPTAGAMWRYAGLDPSTTWDKGQKRPFNLRAKTLCWKVADSFRKAGGYYGDLYRYRKHLESARNEAGEYRELAEKTLKENPKHKQADWYKRGLLPPGRLDLRALRFCVKIFLSHFHECLYVVHKKILPPRPYALAILGHAHELVPPNMEVVPGWIEMRRAAGWAIKQIPLPMPQGYDSEEEVEEE
jgi:hypothetical protein